MNTTSRYRTTSRVLRPLFCLALATACGDSTSDSLFPDPAGEVFAGNARPSRRLAREQRLVTDQLALEQRIELLEQGDGQQRLLASVQGARAKLQGTCLVLDGWALRYNELTFIQSLHLESVASVGKPEFVSPEPVALQSSRGEASSDESSIEESSTVAAPADAVSVIAQYAADLEARGVDLLVVPIPNRAQVYSDLLPGTEQEDGYLGGDVMSPRLLLELSRAGVEVIDLYPVFAAARMKAAAEGDLGQSLYLKFNPHWGPKAVALAAEAISERVRQFAWFEQGPDKEGATFTVESTRYPNPMQERCSPHAELEAVTHEFMLKKGGRLLSSRDTESPILLVGDSYSAIFGREGGSLSNCLHRLIGRGIDDIRIQNGGANSVWQTLARRRVNGVDSKKLVIWVFRMREFLPEQGMTKVTLP